VSRRGTPRAWLKGGPRAVSAPRDDEAREQRLAAKRIATMFGWCSSCGETVDLEKGKLHDKWCPDAAPEQKRAS